MSTTSSCADSPSIPFDFAAFLHQLRPNVQYEITPIVGGLVNEIAHVRRVNGDDDLLPPTFVAKHAPGCLRYPGPPIDFSPVRLAIETRALQLFDVDTTVGNEDERSRLDLLRRGQPNVVIPRVVHYDAVRHVLLQQDLGTLIQFPHWLHLQQPPPTPPPSNEEITSIANALGTFLGTLHNATWDLPPDGRKVWYERFRNDDAERVLFDRTVRPLRALLQSVDVARTNEICDRLEAKWRAFDPSVEGQAAFGHGDCWYPNIPLLVSEGERRVRLAAIDWEFAGMNRAGLDLARYTAFLYLFTKSPLQNVDARLRVETFWETLVESFVRAFGHIRQRSNQQSFARLYGLHICNGAAWHRWCSCSDAESTAVGMSTRRRCDHLTQWVQHGTAWIQYGVADDETGGDGPSVDDEPALRHIFPDGSRT